jgi:hypothetical protein
MTSSIYLSEKAGIGGRKPAGNSPSGGNIEVFKKSIKNLNEFITTLGIELHSNKTDHAFSKLNIENDEIVF